MATRPEAAEPSGLRSAWIVLLGVLFDVGSRGHSPNALQAVFVWTIAGSLALVARDRAQRALLGAAVPLGIFFLLRASGQLLALDVLALALLLCFACVAELRDLGGLRIVDVVGAAFALVGAGLAAPAAVGRPIAPRLRRFRASRARPVARTVVIATPVVIVFAALLAAADRVFARLITPSIRLPHVGDALGHLVLIALGSWAAATLWLAASERSVPPGAPAPRRRLARGEWVAVLAGIDVLFAIFVAVQLAFLFGGHRRVTVTPGLTYAEYARTGFFQLLAVAILTEVVILGVWDLGKRDRRRDETLFRALVIVMVALSFVIVASAVRRLALYESAFGYTTDRLVASIAIWWIAAVLATTATLVLARHRRGLIGSVLAWSFAALLVVNLLDPDAFVADRNVARFRATGKVDVAYLGWSLGADAVPAASSILTALDTVQRSELASALCERRELLGADDPAWRWNLGRARARAALERIAGDLRCDAGYAYLAE